jgi:hypothetical protein
MKAHNGQTRPMSSQATACVANSLGWYEAVLRPHGVSGEITMGVWTCRQRVPPYYSNAITVDASDARVQAEVLRDLAMDLARPFSVKDSFAALELAPLGLRPLFDAEWMWRDPSSGAPEHGPRNLEWRRVTSDEELDRWEAAWRTNGSPANSRVFLPDLLTSGDVLLLAGHQGDRIVAGCAANHTPGVVGFSNFFAEDAERESVMASALGAVMRLAPGLPVVGYDRGDDLAIARRLGFHTVGALRVWLAD